MLHTQTQKKNIQEFIKNASLEITPGMRRSFSSFSEIINPGRRVFVTYLPYSDPNEMIETATELRQNGMEPVPHLAARTMEGPDQLYAILQRLRNEADVRDVLIIGGGGKKPKGDFESTIDMLKTGMFEDFGLRSIGVAGHPEGNTDIPEEEIRKALEFKNNYARTHNIHMYIVTQFVLESAPVFKWLETLEEWGNELPVNIGLPGPATLKALLKYANMCGVNASLSFLRKQGLRAFRLASVSMPDRQLSRLAQYYAETEDCPITRVHFFNFGGLKRTMQFIQAVENGNFEMKRFGRGFNLEDKI